MIVFDLSHTFFDAQDLAQEISLIWRFCRVEINIYLDSLYPPLCFLPYTCSRELAFYIGSMIVFDFSHTFLTAQEMAQEISLIWRFCRVEINIYLDSLYP